MKFVSEILENNLEKFIYSYCEEEIIAKKEPQNGEEIIGYLKKYSNYIVRCICCNHNFKKL